MAIKKIIAVEQTIEEEETFTYKPGEKYTYLKDPLTGKFYRPKDGWVITGDNLEDFFVEVEAQ